MLKNGFVDSNDSHKTPVNGEDENLSTAVTEESKPIGILQALFIPVRFLTLLITLDV